MLESTLTCDNCGQIVDPFRGPAGLTFQHSVRDIDAQHPAVVADASPQLVSRVMATTQILQMALRNPGHSILLPTLARPALDSIANLMAWYAAFPGSIAPYQGPALPAQTAELLGEIHNMMTGGTPDTIPEDWQ